MMAKHRTTQGYIRPLLWFLIMGYGVPAMSVAADELAPCTIDCNTAKGGGDAGQGNNTQDSAAVSVYIDNDIFSSTSNDADYTAGIAVAFSGSKTARHPLSINRGLALINTALGVSALEENSDLTFYTREGGLTLFTPTELEVKSPIRDDRPYASLIYLANTRQNLFLGERRSWISTLSIGLLGLPAISSFQNSIHRTLNTDIAEGWNNQISRGGELTFKYSLAREKYHAVDNEHVQFTTSSGMNVGYITEAFYGGSVRMGALRSPWWSFNVYTSNYGEKSDIAVPLSKHLDEFYFLAGANVKVRAYNVFLQGQFRDSAVTYSAHEVQPVILEGWLGFAGEVSSGIRLGYIVRMQSSEVDTGRAHGRFTYGELTFSYTFTE